MPLIETRSYLAALGTSLPEVYGALSAPVAQGQAQAATADSLTLAASASGTANAYVPMTLRLTGGAGAGQQRQVTAYDGASRKATVDHPGCRCPTPARATRSSIRSPPTAKPPA